MARVLGKCHSLSVFPRINCQDFGNRNINILSNATKTSLELYMVVSKMERTGRVKTDVEDNFAVPDEFKGHANRLIHLHRKKRGESIVSTPFMQCTNEVRTG